MTLTVYKDNHLITASFNLKLSEQRLILSCIGQIKSDEEMQPVSRIQSDPSVSADQSYEKCHYSVSSKEYAERFGITERRAYRELKEIADSLFDRKLTLSSACLSDLERSRFGIGAGDMIKTRWIYYIAFNNEKKSLVIGFSDVLIPYLSQLKREFTKYKLEHVAKMSSVYAIRLYELLIKNQFTQKKETRVNMDELRAYLQLDGKYPLFANFNARVLIPAIKQINEHSNIIASYDLLKIAEERRKVSHLKFKFEFKEELPETESMDTSSDSRSPLMAANDDNMIASKRTKAHA